MKDSYPTKKLPLGLLLISLMLVLIGYNYWSYRYGYCTASSLLSLSLPAILLIVLNIISFGILLGVKARNQRISRQKRCRCGAELRDIWNFCSSCGVARQKK